MFNHSYIRDLSLMDLFGICRIYPFPLHLALPLYGRVSVRLAPVPAWRFVIPDFSCMDLSTKIRLPSVVLTKEGVNPRKSVSKSLFSRLSLCQNRVNLCQNLRESAKSVDIFMQNKAKLQKVKIILIHYMAKGYVNFCSLGQPKNKPKQSQNKPNFNPNNHKTKPIKPNQTQFWLCPSLMFAVRCLHILKGLKDGE